MQQPFLEEYVFRMPTSNFNSPDNMSPVPFHSVWPNTTKASVEFQHIPLGDGRSRTGLLWRDPDTTGGPGWRDGDHTVLLPTERQVTKAGIGVPIPLDMSPMYVTIRL